MTITASGPSAWIASASCSGPAPPPSPASWRASGRLGVTTVARGRTRSIKPAFAFGSSSTAPLCETITGSTTVGAPRTRSSASTTASIVGSSPSMPTLTPSTPMSPATARTWATIISGGTGVTISTPTVFWAVIAVIAVIPCTPQRANAFRSAWIPAPPPESEPAIERQAGMRPLWLIGSAYYGAASSPPGGISVLLAYRPAASVRT